LESGQRQEIFFSPKLPKPDLGSIQPPTRLGAGVVSRPGRDFGHSAPSSADVKNGWSYTSSPPTCLQSVDLNNFYQWSSTNLFRSRCMSLWHSHDTHVRSF